MTLLEELNFKRYNGLFEKFYTEKSIVYDDLVKYKGTNIAGRKVENDKDLAILATVFRDDRWETFRIIYMKDGTVVGENGVTSRLHSSSSAKLDKETAKGLFIRHKVNMKNLDANGYYIMHNHPSKSNHKPSEGDITTTKLFIDNLPGFKGHIITSNSGASMIDKDLHIIEIQSGNSDYSIETIDGKELIRVSQEYEKPDRFTLIYLNNDGEVVLIQTADDFELDNVMQFQDTLFNFKRKIGASGLYLVIYNKDQLDAASVYMASIFETVNAIIYIDQKERRFRTYEKSDFNNYSTKVKGLKKSGTFKNN